MFLGDLGWGASLPVPRAGSAYPLNQPKSQITQRMGGATHCLLPPSGSEDEDSRSFFRWRYIIDRGFVILRLSLQVRRVRLYLYLHPVHWRFSSGRWNGLPSLHRSCCLRPTPGFSPSDTGEGTFPWRPPVHATRGRHSSSAPWFAPKNKARTMWAEPLKERKDALDWLKKTLPTCWKDKASCQKQWTWLHQTLVKISYTLQTLLISYSVAGTRLASGTKVRTCDNSVLWKSGSILSRNAADALRPKSMFSQSRTWYKSHHQSGPQFPHHEIEVTSYMTANGVQSKNSLRFTLLREGARGSICFKGGDSRWVSWSFKIQPTKTELWEFPSQLSGN